MKLENIRIFKNPNREEPGIRTYYKLDDCKGEYIIRRQKRGYGKRKFKAGIFKRRLKRRRSVILAVLLFAGMFISFFYLNGIANAEREYNAIGGEIFVFISPVIIVCLRDMINDFIDIKRHK